MLIYRVSFPRQLIYNYPEQLFADNGVMAIEHADFEGVERLALVTGNFSYNSEDFLNLQKNQSFLGLDPT